MGHCYKHRHISESVCPDCKIDRLKGELEEARQSIAKQAEAKDKACVALQHQLSEARAELEDLKFAYKAARDDANEARQQVANEFIEMMGGWPISNTALITCRDAIRRHFGLEG